MPFRRPFQAARLKAALARGLACAGICSLIAISLPPRAGADDPAEKPRPKLTLKPADADGDGLVTQSEWSRLMQTFSRLDANGDGAIELPELQAAAETKDEPLLWKLADSSGDGKVTRPEWAHLARNFRQFDQNRDRSLDRAELEAAAAVDHGQKPIPIPVKPGLWRGWIVDGRGEDPNNGMMQVELLIVGNTIAGREVTPQGGSTAPNLGVGTFVMAGNSQAGYLDALYTGGPHAGRQCLGIFRTQGRELHWCVSNRTGQRPDGFATGNGYYLLILRNILDFPPAPKLTAQGRLDSAKATPAELRGEQVFFQKGRCAACHPPPLFMDNQQHDLQLERFTGRAADGPIGTPTLRGIKDTAPYLHGGRAQTLEQTIEFFNLVLGTQLTPGEKADLAAYLRAL